MQNEAEKFTVVISNPIMQFTESYAGQKESEMWFRNFYFRSLLLISLN